MLESHELVELYNQISLIEDYVITFWDIFTQNHSLESGALKLYFDIRCVIAITSDFDMYTFDKKNKIRVILPREKILEKISQANNITQECHFHRVRVDLINPSIDIKIGKDDQGYYSAMVIYAEDYIKLDRQGKGTFGNCIRFEFKRLPYVDIKIQNTMKKVFVENSDIITEIQEKINRNDLFYMNDYLLLVGIPVPKGKNEEKTGYIFDEDVKGMITDEQVIMELNIPIGITREVQEEKDKDKDKDQEEQRNIEKVFSNIKLKEDATLFEENKPDKDNLFQNAKSEPRLPREDIREFLYKNKDKLNSITLEDTLKWRIYSSMKK